MGIFGKKKGSGQLGTVRLFSSNSLEPKLLLPLKYFSLLPTAPISGFSLSRNDLAIVLAAWLPTTTQMKKNIMKKYERSRRRREGVALPSYIAGKPTIGIVSFWNG
ncbi:hypothetical protein Csa_005082 [Cucumis sativus]|uniref:Uncharacterized protein n=1 Tax=Cucumis sativus TaxID=3659 RepID=A0A0A0KAV6_CUCSA|nr:hypothetical protein Csa_005082 [Cucumis sativus]